MKKTTSKVKKDPYQIVTDRIIELLEQGVKPWVKPWNSYGTPKNYSTDKNYRGFNALWLNILDFEVPYFMTFKQAKEMKGNVRKGEKATSIFFFKWIFKDENGKYIQPKDFKNAKDIIKFPVVKTYYVFNISQIDGIDFEVPEIEANKNHSIKICDNFIDSFKSKPKIVFDNKNQAYYSPIFDKINMPGLEQFHSSEEYYSTLFHELGHWTGHAERLARPGITDQTKFGDHKYSKEELIAEMFSSFCCAHTGIDLEDITENSAAYLLGWIEKLKGNKKLLIHAAAAAQKAFDFVTDKKFEVIQKAAA